MDYETPPRLAPGESFRAEAERLLQERCPVNQKSFSVEPGHLVAELLEQRHELQVHQIELELQNRELARAQLEVEEAHQEFSHLFDSAPVGYLTLDEHAMIQRANRQAACLLGIEASRLKGRRFTAYLDANNARSFALFLRRVFNNPGQQRLETRLVSAADEGLYVQIDGEVTPLTAGKVQKALGLTCRLTLSDITAQRRAQEKVLRLNTQLESRIEQRTEQLRDVNSELEMMMFAVTHDLQAPLRRISDFAEEMLRAQTPEQQRQHLRRIQQSTEQVDRLLLALQSYFRAGQQRMRFQNVDMERVLKLVLRDATPLLSGRDIEITHDPLLPVYGHTLSLQMVLHNLLDNAIKFTQDEEAARIHISAKSNPREVVVSVRDNGVGFNQRQKERLFGAFQRLHQDDEYGGVGMRLALARRIIHRHGGRIWAEGVVGEGATFYFSLPQQGER